MHINEGLPASVVIEDDRIDDRVLIIEVRVNRRRVEEHPIRISRKLAGKSEEVIGVLDGSC